MTSAPIKIRGPAKLVASSLESNLMWPNISGDGKTVVYAQDGSEQGLYKYSQGETVQLSADEISRADVSYDGHVVTAMKQKGSFEKEIHRWTGDNKSECLQGNRGFVRPTDVSDDGQTVVWEDFQNDDFGRHSEVRMWSDGGVQRPTGGDKVSEPKISGDGKTLFWARSGTEYGSKQILKTKLGETTQVLDLHSYDVDNFAVDDKGQNIVFTERYAEGGPFHWDIYLHDSETGKTKDIADDPYLDELHPSISGDGSTIAYTARPESGPSTIRLYRAGKTYELETPDRGYNLAPKLSDDGNTIAWTYIGDERKTYLMDLQWPEQKSEISGGSHASNAQVRPYEY